MCNYLFGFEKWDHFKAFVKAAFVQYDDVDVNVQGGGLIISFENIASVV